MTRKAALLVLVLNAGITIALLALYAVVFDTPNTPAFAVLDVAELYRLKEREVAAVLMKPDATPDERHAALKRAQAFGANLTALIEHLPAQCRCLIVARGAVIGSAAHLPDLTPSVRQRLGL
jgi:hypothetical protein